MQGLSVSTADSWNRFDDAEEDKSWKMWDVSHSSAKRNRMMDFCLNNDGITGSSETKLMLMFLIHRVV